MQVQYNESFDMTSSYIYFYTTNVVLLYDVLTENTVHPRSEAPRPTNIQCKSNAELEFNSSTMWNQMSIFTPVSSAELSIDTLPSSRGSGR